MTFEERAQRKHLITFVRRGNLIPQEVGQPGGFDKELHLRLLFHLGFRDIEEHYSFFKAKFPKGWKLVVPPLATYWCYLVDEQGRKRAGIIYKFLGFNKRKFNPDTNRAVKTIQVVALINYMQRFRVQVDYVIPYNVNKKNLMEHKNSGLIGKILDGDKVIYQTSPVYNSYPYHPDSKNEEFAKEEVVLRNRIFNDCQALLEVSYPDNTSILKYWGWIPPEELEHQTAGTNVILTQRLGNIDKPNETVVRKEIARGIISASYTVVLTSKTEHYKYAEDELDFYLIKLREIQVEVYDSAIPIPEKQLKVLLPEEAGKVPIGSKITLKGITTAPVVVINKIEKIENDEKLYFVRNNKEYYVLLSEVHEDTSGLYTLTEYKDIV